MKHKFCAESDSILIRPLRDTDLEYLRSWRNDPELSTYLRDIPFITSDAQIKWFENYINDSNTLYFVIIDKGREVPVGSAALYNFEDDKCEVGKIIIGDPSSHGKGIGYRSLLLVITIAIQKLGIGRIRLDVHEDNTPAKTIYEKAGFKAVGRHVFEKGGFEVEMETNPGLFYGVNPIARTIKVFMEDEMASTVFINLYGGGV